LRDQLVGIILVMPMLLTIISITLFPLIFSYYMSVHNMTVLNFWNPIFVGVDNFVKALSSSDFRASVRFSVLYMLVTASAELLLGLFLSLFLERTMKGKRLVVSLILIPMAIAPALFGIMIKLMLNEFIGLIPYLLRQIGIRMHFFSDFPIVFTVLVVTDMIQWTPFVFIILYAALHSLPREPIEAAYIDGASGWQVIRYVKIPMLWKIIALVTVFRVMDALRTFDTIYVLTGGGPGISTTTVSINIFKVALIRGDFGLAAASTVIFFYLSMVVLSFGLRTLRRGGVL
jgi:multiple sugar transport system permease protein